MSLKLTTKLTLHLPFFVCLNLTTNVSKNLTMYKCLYSYQPGLSSYKYSVIFTAGSEIFERCSELNQPILFLTSLVITDSVMNISEHLSFSAEHYWRAANSKRPWKKPKQVIFLILMLNRREIENFRITFNGLFWEILGMWLFHNLCFLLIPCQKTCYRKKKSDKY